MTALNDFADGISPMLVKELRQGMCSRVFVSTLLLLQCTLLILAIVGLLAAAQHEDTEGVGELFWTIAGVFLILVLPLSGLSAVAGERTANTLDLIFLTRLSARRIIFGKWLSIVAQIALLVFTILPYIVLRYFIGGVDMGQELLAIASLLFISALLSAIAVGISPLPLAARVFLLVALFFGVLFLGGGFLAMTLSGMRGMGGGATWETWAVFGVGGIFVILFLLEYGAARIAPPAENHSSSLRGLALAVVLTGIALDWIAASPNGTMTIWALVVVSPVVIGALCEEPSAIANVYRPFVRRGILGRAAGWFLYPGWPSAVLYAVALMVIVAAGRYFAYSAPSPFVTHMLAPGWRSIHRGPHYPATPLVQHQTWSLGYPIIIAGTFLFPVAVLRFFSPRSRSPFALYLGFQAMLAILFAFASILAEFKLGDCRPWLDNIPGCALLASLFGSLPLELFWGVMPGVAFLTASSLGVLSWKARLRWREMRTLERKAGEMTDREIEPAPAVAVAPSATA